MRARLLEGSSVRKGLEGQPFVPQPIRLRYDSVSERDRAATATDLAHLEAACRAARNVQCCIALRGEHHDVWLARIDRIREVRGERDACEAVMKSGFSDIVDRRLARTRSEGR